MFEERICENKTQEVNLELAEIVDVQAIQSLMDDFYKFAHITIAMVDLKGNILVSVGWQDICTKFHRVHPMTCRFCVESDTKLSAGVSLGEFKLYKCKNNMWDIATPIIVGGLHLGNIFSGQFFFEDEPLDYELFRSQARLYGFNEEEYMAALEKVPRMSRETVETSMSFFMKLANMISQLSYSNIKLAQSLADQDTLVYKLQESRKDFDRAQAVGNIGSWRLNVCKNELTWSDQNYLIFGIPKGTPLTYETFLSTVHPDDRKYVDKKWKAGLTGEPYDIEHRIIIDGIIKWVREKAYLEFDNKGVLLGGFGITQDITERKKTEEALRKSHETLEAKVKERTIELEQAYRSLKKIEVARKQEIHHRIKNNLQVISSLLDLQAEQFKGRKHIMDSEVQEAFKESQNRVISMALIHEELHKGGELDTLNFSHYIKELADNLFLTYRIGNTGTSLVTDIEEDIFFDIDISVPLGIIINELVSNSLKHAFLGGNKGEIRIKLFREEKEECKTEDGKSTTFILSVSDNGIGISKNIEIKDLDSLGLQLVITLVDQLDGELKLNRDNGTKITIRFTVTDRNNKAPVTSPQIVYND